MGNPALINPSPDQKALRNVGRIKTLRIALQKHGIKEERKASLQAELDRRLAEVESLKAALAEV